jgi:hypothetical protein
MIVKIELVISENKFSFNQWINPFVLAGAGLASFFP